MAELLQLFASTCAEASTLTRLQVVLRDRGKWKQAHDLFQDIRQKNVAAEQAGDGRLVAQYRFEEACAKTIYNLGGFTAPFDSDSPYWVVPTAIYLAKAMSVAESDVLAIVTKPEEL
jgi:hypothetical protein